MGRQGSDYNFGRRKKQRISCLFGGCCFPTKYVEIAKRIGFDKMTVGKVMFDEKFVEDSKDPHKSISHKSRKEYLFETLLKLAREDL